MASLTALEHTPLPQLVLRCLMGGLLMGLANLVPGISGGTMLLAAGVYPNFIQSISDLTRMQLKLRPILTLATIALAALVAAVVFAGPVKDLVVHFRWAMYSLFIGLTLGGVPIVWRLVAPGDRQPVWLGAAGGFSVMAAIALAQSGGHGGAESQNGLLFMFLAGMAGASAMILPGISGAYLLLVLGVYVPILSAISECKDALKAMDIDAAWGPGLTVILPVGLGVLVGIFVVSNTLRVALARYEKTTLGALLGFLVGAVIGLWPFQRGVPPALGSRFKGQIVSETFLREIEPAKYPTEFFNPDLTQVIGAVFLMVIGFGLTAALARIGQVKTESK